LLSVEKISKSYRREKILHEIDFGVEKGEVLGLLGPNGAGKTTLMRIINRIVDQDKGYVLFDGKVLNSTHLSQIGYLPEERGLYRTMTVYKQLLYLAQLRGMSVSDARNQILFWLDKFNILDWQKKRIEELSKGMAQKVQFIATVLHDPSLLILDEPFSGFDPVNIELIRGEIDRFKSEGRAILISTHNMNSVEAICDRAVLINHGEMILKGGVNELRNQHKDGLYEICFEGSMIAFANALWVGYEIIDKRERGENKACVRLKMRKENSINDLLNAVMNEVKIISVDEVLPGMEEIFVKSVQSNNSGSDE
jgi:ABC-2 type transport system ATP-binding protein